MLEEQIRRAVEDVVAVKGRAQVGIMGGTFDPPHLGHVALADAAQMELGLDVMVYVPAGVPSFKRDRRIADGRDRIAMVRLAVADRPGCFVSAIEVRRPGITYTADTLEALASSLTDRARLTMVMGADAYATLPLWHRADYVARHARIAWAARAGEDTQAVRSAIAQSGLEVDSVQLAVHAPSVSSTEVRTLVAQGEDVSDLVGPDVADYIRCQGLYTAKGELDG